ncbi:MAG TPA: ATP-binding protein [Longimicrobium sp.]|jgi:hypothetical protein|uniref:AAA family ATPase n=1 Tax=Longimicrobium sp. TaxID=2029185 RepID=UPI002ED8E165
MSARSWTEANQRHLTASIAVVRAQLEARAGDEGAPRAEARARDQLARAQKAMHAPAALDALVQAFGLSEFERGILLLCAGAELDGGFAALLGRVHGDPARPYATLGLALAVLPDAHWSALSPASPLRRWRMVEVGAGTALTAGPLRIDERVLHHLAGVRYTDGRLAGLMETVAAPEELVESHAALARQVAATWGGADDGAPLPAVQLHGPDPASRRAVAADACRLLGLELGAVAAHALPTAPAELEELLRVWEREAAFSPAALLVERDDADTPDPAREAALTRVVDGLNAPLLLSGREPRSARQRPLVNVEVPRPTRGEQRALWTAVLGPAAKGMDEAVERMAEQFTLGPPAVRAAAAAAQGRVREAGGRGGRDALAAALWEACRQQARPALEELAQRIPATAGWDDLVLPPAQAEVLRGLAAQVRDRPLVHGRWGWAGRGSRGLGITALFAGESGTGKTTAAEVVAHELGLDLFRIDLSGVVSKYIGETEKNLRRVFDVAEEGGAVLLFDEADALFGRRGEVKDSNDRHANVEVAYLLQRMEAYPGLAVLTSNLPESLDPAFLRRIRFIVHFPFPDAAQRAEIWRRAFPKGTPTQGLRPDDLARLNVAGGNIRNIALNGTFLAAAAGTPVTMELLLRAARMEYDKLRRPLPDGEVRGWA